MSNTQRAALILCFILLYALVTTSYGPMLSNGDFERVTRSMGLVIVHPGSIVIARGAPLGDAYPFTTSAGLPVNTLGALAYLLYWPQKVLGLSVYHTTLIADGLNLLYFSAVYLLIGAETRRGRRGRRGLLGLAFAALYLIYGFFFKSLYQDAMVLALSPWLLLGLQRINQRRQYTIFIVASMALMLTKVQMVFIVPVIVAIMFYTDRRFYRQGAKRLMVEGVLLCAALSMLSFNGIDHVNNYDRYYNGLGWTLQNVMAWPVSSFYPRLQYFYRNRPALQAQSQSYEPTQSPMLLGTSCWPSEVKILISHLSPQALAHELQIMDVGKMRHFFAFMWWHPRVITPYLRTIYQMSASSNYALHYLRTPAQSDSWWARALYAANEQYFAYAGYAFFALGGLLLLSGDVTIACVALYFFLGAPLFVCLGDGFYEFEKHLNVYFMLLPLCLFLPCYRPGPEDSASSSSLERESI